MSDREPKKANYDNMEPLEIKCKYRHCDNDVEVGFCSDLCKRLERSAKMADKKRTALQNS